MATDDTTKLHAVECGGDVITSAPWRRTTAALDELAARRQRIPTVTEQPSDACDQARAGFAALVAYLNGMPREAAAAYVTAVRAPFDTGVDVELRMRLGLAGVERPLDIATNLPPTGR